MDTVDAPSVEQAARDLQRLLYSTLNKKPEESVNVVTEAATSETTLSPIQKTIEVNNVQLLSEEVSQMEKKFMEDTKLLMTKQSQLAKLQEETENIKKLLQDYSIKIKEAQAKLLSANAQTLKVQEELTDLCETIDRDNKLIQKKKGQMTELKAKIVIPEPTEAVDFSSSDLVESLLASVKYDPQLAIPLPAESVTQVTKVENKVKEIKESHRPKFTVLNPKSPHEQQTCYFFNIGACQAGSKCRMAHECAHCGEKSHYYLKCTRRPHICTYYNKGNCLAANCFRQHICLFCHEEHPLMRCYAIGNLTGDAPQKDSSKFCMNWNSSGLCRMEGCSKSFMKLISIARLHSCLHCLRQHPSLDCTNVVHVAMNSNRKRIVLAVKASGSIDTEKTYDQPPLLTNQSSYADSIQPPSNYYYDPPRSSSVDYYAKYEPKKRYSDEPYTPSSRYDDKRRKMSHDESMPYSAADKYCRMWNQTGSCRFGETCRYSHFCRSCGSTSHGALDCRH